MLPLDTLIADARALARGEVLPGTAEAEVARQLQICNACRYCEGFCAVFPAMTRRLSFNAADVHYLANLCHNCGACLHACQYAPPHEFAVNVPQAMARVRHQTYTTFAWPRALGVLYRRNGLTLALVAALALAAFLYALIGQGARGSVGPAAAITVASTTATATAPGFYDLLPHNTLVALFAPVFLYAVLALGLSVRRFWRNVSPAREHARPELDAVRAAAASEAAHDALRLRYLDGGHGEGCHNEDDAWTHARRHAHHATVAGFLLCFAATSVATLEHYLLGWSAPYDLPNLAKILGVAGGALLCVGTAGLMALNLRRHPLHGDAAQRPMDRAFMALLFGTGATGLALWLARGTAGVPLWLALHLGCVMALFLTLPYGKFAHGFHRSGALLKYAIERRLPNRLGLGSD